MTGPQHYDRSTALTGPQPYDRSTALWQVHSFMTGPQSYDRSTALWQVHSLMIDPQSYDRSTALWQVHSLMTGSQPYDRSTALWQVHSLSHSMFSRQWSSASFHFQYFLISSRSSNGWFRLLYRLPVTSIYPSITCSIWHFLRKMWSIRLPFHFYCM